jgi:hypothetical protein
MRQIIPLFLSSSLKKLDQDREVIASFVQMMNSKLKSNQVYISLITVDEDDAIAQQLPSTAYIKEVIAPCKLAFFIVDIDWDNLTDCEFDVAYEVFQTLKDPRIIVLFKQADLAVLSDKAKHFEEKIRTELNHYYSVVHDENQLKLRLLIEITLNMPELNLRLENGSCYLDKVKLDEIDLKQSALYQNHHQLHALQRELATSVSKLQDPNLSESDFTREVDKSQDIRQKIYSIEHAMLHAFMKLYDDAGQHRMTPLMKSASPFIESGNYERAAIILSKDAVLTQTQKTEQLVEKGIAEFRNMIRAEINTLMASAQMQIQLKGLKNTQDIFDVLEKACDLSDCYQATLEPYPFYLSLMRDYNDPKKKKLIQRYIDSLEMHPWPEEEQAYHYAELGKIILDQKQAYAYYATSYLIYKKLHASDSYKFIMPFYRMLEAFLTSIGRDMWVKDLFSFAHSKEETLHHPLIKEKTIKLDDLYVEMLNEANKMIRSSLSVVDVKNQPDWSRDVYIAYINTELRLGHYALAHHDYDEAISHLNLAQATINDTKDILKINASWLLDMFSGLLEASKKTNQNQFWSNVMNDFLNHIDRYHVQDHSQRNRLYQILTSNPVSKNDSRYKQLLTMLMVVYEDEINTFSSDDLNSQFWMLIYEYLGLSILYSRIQLENGSPSQAMDMCLHAVHLINRYFDDPNYLEQLDVVNHLVKLELNELIDMLNHLRKFPTLQQQHAQIESCIDELEEMVLRCQDEDDDEDDEDDEGEEDEDIEDDNDDSTEFPVKQEAVLSIPSSLKTGKNQTEPKSAFPFSKQDASTIIALPFYSESGSNTSIIKAFDYYRQALSLGFIKPKKAMSLIKKSLTLFIKASSKQPTLYTAQVTCCYISLGDGFMHQQKRKNALKQYREAKETIHDATINEPMKYALLMRSFERIGRAYLVLNKPRKSKPNYEKYFELMTHLYQVDLVFKQEVKDAYQHVLDLYLKLNVKDKVLKRLNQQMALIEGSHKD